MVEQKDAPAKRGRRSKAETAGAAATAAAATAAASSAASVAIPGLGKTRCYWAVMDSNMTFRYLDPVLQSHMQEVSCVCDFIAEPTRPAACGPPDLDTIGIGSRKARPRNRTGRHA